MKMGNFDDYLLVQSIEFMQKHSQYGMSPLQSVKTLEMGDENMEKREFKVGDKIRIVKHSMPYLNGKTAIITEIEENGIDYRPYYPYHVRLIHRPTEVTRLESYEMELVEEKEMKPFEILLKHWGIEVGEKFIIKEGVYDYYYFDSKGVLKDNTEAYAGINPWDLVTGRKTIEKFKPAKEMTVAEIEKELGYAIKVVKEKK